MKKVRFVFVPLIIICLMLSVFAVACAYEKLDTPQNISINLDNYYMYWSKVDHARGYQIEVKSDDGDETKHQYFDVGSSKVSYSLQVLEEGDYQVRIKATAGTSASYSDSNWSGWIGLNKDYYSGCSFSLVNNGTAYEVTGWTKPTDGTTDITIPDEYRDLPVIGIADSAFKSKTTLTSIVIGSNVQYIGKNAFYSCTKLLSVEIPESVTEIGEGAFHSCRSLTSVRIPSGVTELSSSAFLYCRALESIDLGNVESIGSSAFMGCNSENLTEIVIPDSVSSMGEKAFADCSGLTDVVIGSGVEEIPAYAFQNDKALKKVEFKADENKGSALTAVDDYAFSGCTALEEVALPQGLKSIGERAFYKNSALVNINIPKTVEKIGSDAFSGTALYDGQEDSDIVYAGLESSKENEDDRAWVIGFNEDVAEKSLTDSGSTSYAITSDSLDSATIGIADYAFYKATVISTVELSGNIQYIGDHAFYGNSSLYRVVIGGAVLYPPDVYIGSYAFAMMDSLSVFRFYATGCASGVKTVGDHCFYGDSLLGSVDIPESVESIGAYAFYNSGVYTSSESQVIYAGGTTSSGAASYKWVVGYNGYTPSTVQLESGTRGIADYAFTRDTYLQEVTNMTEVEYLGEGAFYRCTNLTDVSVPRRITGIGDYCFYNCTSLKSLGNDFDSSLGGNLKSIGRSAFYDCESLAAIDLSSTSVEYIGEYAFFNCTSLTKLNLPQNTLTEIDDYAFYKSGLEEINLPNTLERVGAKAFYKCPNLTSVDFGSGDTALKIDEYAFYKCEALESVYIPGRVEEVGQYAFYGCLAAESLIMEEGLKTIRRGAFASMESITSLHIPSSVKEIDSYAFKGCKNLRSVIIPATCEIIENYAFYGLDGATIYVEADGYAPQWSTKLNSSFRPMVWGCTLSEDKTHVVSVSIFSGSVENTVRIEDEKEEVEEAQTGVGTENGEENEEATSGSVKYRRLCGAPEWEGHEFLGWSLSENGEIVCSDEEIDLIFDLYGEVTLYALWS